jgi:hypothetical protein
VKTFIQNIEIEHINITIGFRPILCAMNERLWLRLSADERSFYCNIRNEYRQKEWSEARLALFDIYDHYGKSENTKHNLSHAWWNGIGMAVAVVYDSKDSDLKVGVDIEHRDQAISDTLMRFLSIDPESLLVLDPISLWNIKEACFKAGKDGQSEDFRNYQIQNFDSLLNIGEVQERNSLSRYRFKLISQNCWSVAVSASI